jgi:hypothetical protein
VPRCLFDRSWESGVKALFDLSTSSDVLVEEERNQDLPLCGAVLNI